ncbi:MFS transporter, partial [Enterococcus lactis]
FGYGTVSTATNAIVTAYIPASKKGEGINYYGLSTSLAAAVGPFLGMILLNMTDFRFIIWFSIVLVFFVTIACLVFPVKNIPLSEEQKTSLRSWNINSFIEKKALFITGIAFLMGLSYSSVLSFLSSYTKVIHLVAAGSFFFVVYALVITFTRPLTGRIFDVKGEQYVMYPSYLFLTAGLFLLSVTTNSVTLLISGALVGLGYGTFMSNGQAVCLKIVKEHRISIALSTYFIGLDLGLGVGPYLMGMLKSLTSFRGLYVIAGVIPLICTALYLANGRKHSHEAEGELIESLKNEI